MTQALLLLLIGAALSATVFAPGMPWARKLRHRMQLPIASHATTNPDYLPGGPGVTHDFFLPLATPPAAPDGYHTSWWDWARQHGGCEAEETRIAVFIQTLDTAALLRRISVPHVAIDAPAGLIASQGGRGGGPADVQELRLSLDTPQSLEPEREQGGPFRDWKLDAGDLLILDLHIAASTGRKEFWIELHFLIDGRDIVQTLDDEGAPFAVVGVDGLPRYWSEGPGDPWRQ
jgi:hypothetical protein